MLQGVLLRAQSDTNLSTIVDEILTKPLYKGATVSISLYDAASDKALYTHNKNTLCVPASTQKIITTIAGFDILGANKKFTTTIGYAGTIKQDTLHGNLIIKGGGDPTFGSGKAGALSMDKALDEIKKNLVSKGVRYIKGDIIGDGSIYESKLSNPNWVWGDIGNYYGIGPGGLNINENKIYLTFRQNTTLFEKPTFKTSAPRYPNIKFINELTSGPKGSGDQAYIYGSPYQNTRYIRGSIPIGNTDFKIKGSVPNPALFFASLLADKLKPIHNGEARTGSESDVTPLFQIQSPTLDKIATETNKKSNNLFAESILKAIAYENCQSGSFEDGALAISSHFVTKGLEMQYVTIKDGSGLSPKNKISSFDLCQILGNTYKSDSLYTNIIGSLPRVGIDGTVRRMLTTSPAKGNIYVKSGTMEMVRNYAGYIDTRLGKVACFTIMVNNFTGKSSEVKKDLATIMEAMYLYY